MPRICGRALLERFRITSLSEQIQRDARAFFFRMLRAAPAGPDLGGDGSEAITFAVLSSAKLTCNGRKIASPKLSPELVEIYLTDHLEHQFTRPQCGLISCELWGVNPCLRAFQGVMGHRNEKFSLMAKTSDRSIRIAAEAGCPPIDVLLGAYGESILSGCTLHGLQLISNPRWDAGIESSRGHRSFVVL